jgi:hypothetical protein
MSDHSLERVRGKLLRLLRSDPPARGVPLALDQYVLARFSREEMEVLLRAEREYGEHAMSEWLSDLLVEAGIVPVPLPLAG